MASRASSRCMQALKSISRYCVWRQEHSCMVSLPSPQSHLRLPAVVQDYNIEVLREVTIPAVSANWNAYILRNRTAFASSSKDVPARFFSGHWASVERKIEELGLAHSYDVILTAETIYSLDSIASLLSCIWKVRTSLRPIACGISRW